MLVWRLDRWGRSLSDLVVTPHGSDASCSLLHLPRSDRQRLDRSGRIGVPMKGQEVAEKTKNRPPPLPDPLEGAPRAGSAAVEPSAFPVVGIGASAGGLEAFRSLFAGLPATTGIAFVVIQHLSPEHTSMLTSALVRLTKMPVVEVTEGMPLVPDRLHVMAANTEVSVKGSALHLVRGRQLAGCGFRSTASSARSPP